VAGRAADDGADGINAENQAPGVKVVDKICQIIFLVAFCLEYMYNEIYDSNFVRTRK